MKKSDKDKLMLNGKEYTVLGWAHSMCPSCGEIHRVILLESFLEFNTGTFRYSVPKRSYYCTYSGFLFADLELRAQNEDAIRRVVSPFSRGNVSVIFTE